MTARQLYDPTVFGQPERVSHLAAEIAELSAAVERLTYLQKDFLRRYSDMGEQRDGALRVIHQIRAVLDELQATVPETSPDYGRGISYAVNLLAPALYARQPGREPS